MHTIRNERHLTSELLVDAHPRRRTSRAYARQLALLPVLAVALTLALATPASAQSTFQADVRSTQTRPAGPCTNGAYICGTADLPGYGAATWDMFITGYGPDYSACGSTYSATTYITLTSEQASTLVLDEAGNLCGLGHDGDAYRAYFVQGSQSFGHPFAIVGSWTVDSASTGQFAGLAGSGTDRINLAGASIGGSYTGDLTP